MFNMCWITRKQSENSRVWTFAVGFKSRDIFQEFARAAVDMQRITVCLQKRNVFHGWIRLKRWRLILKLFTTASNEDWVKTCLWRLRLKLPVMSVKSPMKSINKTLFPSNAIENPTKVSSSRSKYWISWTVRSSVPVVVRAFPNCVNTWHHNFFPAGASSRQNIPVLPTQTNRTCQANKETQPESNVAENLSEQVSELFVFYYAKCSKSYSP